MITPRQLKEIVRRLQEKGYGKDVDRAEEASAPSRSRDFALEAIFVICNSGMKSSVATRIYKRVAIALYKGESASTVFGHSGKCEAIDQIWRDRKRLFHGFKRASDKVEYCATLPFIGSITKFHLAKNCGLDVVKPDVHIQRLADLYQITPDEMCRSLARRIGLRAATVDTILWRAAATGIINSRTGEISRANR